jgi:DNA-binding NarL/FixJ family response regulator
MVSTQSTPARTRLVIADDSPAYLELLLAVLGQLPQLEIVGSAVNGREAVQFAVEREADIALLDIEMPLLDGIAAAEEIRRLRPHTDLFLHTSMLVDERRRQANQLNLPVFDKLELAQTVDLVSRARPIYS